MIDFEAYRAAYDGMSYADIVAWHEQVWKLYPDQDKHSTEHLEAFFRQHGSSEVLEVGGWRGEAASAMLAQFPGITGWHNYELCRSAAYTPVTDDPRYVGTWPSDWVWHIAPPRADTAVLSHVIEHMRAEQVRLLAGWISAAGVERVYVEAPIPDEPRSWRRSSSFHVLELGWDGVIPMFEAHGFLVFDRLAYPPDRRVVVFGK